MKILPTLARILNASRLYITADMESNHSLLNKKLFSIKSLNIKTSFFQKRPA